ncbi:MAG: HAD family phosphatase [Candidatus Aenigmarchaeota archaeon]|nr:HAD family phosphatase [Candidatus Aenigmarchaeota archaeon]
MKALIFDIDGVVLNSPHETTFGKALKKMGIEGFTPEIYHMVASGRPRMKGAENILKELKIFKKVKDLKERQALVKKLYDLKQEFMDECIEKGQFTVFDSAVKIIKEAKRKGILIIAASSSKNAKKMLIKAGIYKLFDYDILGADLEHGKPAPDIFLLAAKAANLKPKDCIVFEDAPAGVEAAKAAGMFCIGVASHGHREWLKGADAVVDDLSEVSLNSLVEMHGKV